MLRLLRPFGWAIRGRYRKFWIVRGVRQFIWTRRMAANNGICSIEIANDGVGFFAQLNWCVGICQYCEANGLVPDIRLTGDIYLDRLRGSNWLDHYFDWTNPVGPGELLRRVRYTKRIVDFSELGGSLGSQLSLVDGARLLRKYLRPKPHISAEVEEFWRRIDGTGAVVGVHFRGTDKTFEASRVSWQHCLDVVRAHLRANSDVRAVFVASDEQAFVEFMAASIREPPVCFRADHIRSVDGRPVHLSAAGNGYEKGKDALVNSLLLAKCSTLIRTTSLLSAYSSLFNPELKVILLNRPLAWALWYPEREILQARNTEYRPAAPALAGSLHLSRP